MTGSRFGELFNSPLEAGIRAVVLLEHIRPLSVDLAEMILLDHVVVHAADFDGPESLHPDLPARRGELLVRRRLLEESLDMMRRCHLVEREATDEGFTYRASDEAYPYVDLLESSYSTRLKRCAVWIGERVAKVGLKAFAQELRARIGTTEDLHVGPTGAGATGVM